MRTNFPGKRSAIYVAVMFAGLSLPITTQAQDNSSDIEEVVVTGSYIRGTPLDAPSPVQVIDRDNIEAQGAAIIWDVIKNLEVNSGSVTNPGSGDRDQLIGTANVNLRNLGENSTLTLINGKRMVSAATATTGGGEFVDLNTIPLVMTERVEVLTDGGSALYGSDAVAGVVNIIMRTDFEGLEVYGDVQGIAEASGLYDKTASAIWGWASDDGDTHFVLSGEFFDRDEVGIEHANFFDANSEFTGTVGNTPTVLNVAAYGAQLNPAWINQSVINQAIAEGGTGSLRLTDPLCDDLTSADGTPFFVGTRTSQRGSPSSSCRENSYDWSNISVAAERTSIAGAFNHAFNESVEFYSFMQYSESDTLASDSGWNGARGPQLYLAQPGAHRTGGIGVPGYAMGGALELGYFAAAAGNTRPTSIPNAPIAGFNGGTNVASYMNTSVGFPRVGGEDNLTEIESGSIQSGFKGEFYANDKRYNYDVGYSWSYSSLEQNYRTFHRERTELAANGLGGPNCTPNGVSDFNFAKTTVSGLPTAWTFGGLEGLYQTFFPGFVFNTRETISQALTSSNQGVGGCEFYNPFLTSLTNPELANSPELIEWLNPNVRRADKRNKMAVFDAVLSGELFEMAGGTAQFAVGAQYRETNHKSKAPEMSYPGQPNAILGYDAAGKPNRYHYVSNNLECSQCVFNFDHDRDVTATFIELSLPFIDNVETQIALRYEDYGGNIGGEVTPKIALSWRPIDTLLLRTSFSQSFRAPNVGVVLQGLESASNTFRDPIRSQAVRAGMLEPTNANSRPNFTYTVGEPAPNVGNEYADTYNIGFMWTPDGDLDGFSVQADFWRFELTDKVLPQPPISAISGELEAFNIAKQDPKNYVLNSSLDANAAVPYQSCDPNALSAQHGNALPPVTATNEQGPLGDLSFPTTSNPRPASPNISEYPRLNCVVDPRTYQVPGVVRTTGVTTGSLVTTVLSTINAGTITADGVDIKMGYNWDTDFGRFSVGLDYTHVNQYKLADVPGFDLGLLETGLFDAAGTTGDNNLVRSLPDNKGHLTFNWMQDNHSVTAINRHIGSYQDLSYDQEYQNGNDLVRSLLRKQIDSYSTWDLQYNYAHTWANSALGTTRFTFGLLDAFNEDLPYREAGGLNYDAGVFDGRGRRFYARALMQF